MARNLTAYWKPEWYAQVYELARDGMAVTNIGPAIGITEYMWKKCWKGIPAVRDAAKRGMEANKSRKDYDGMPGYVFRHLPKELREVWNELERVFDVEKDPEAFVEGIMSGFGISARKALYLHALVCSSFDGHAACRKIGVTSENVIDWCRNDPGFAKLVKEEVLEIKKDLVEGAVFKAVQRGSTPELLWAAKCLLKSRGYSTSKDEAQDRVADALTAKVTLDALGVEDLKALLQVVRANGMTTALPPKQLEGVVVENVTTQGDV